MYYLLGPLKIKVELKVDTSEMKRKEQISKTNMLALERNHEDKYHDHSEQTGWLPSKTRSPRCFNKRS